MPLVSNPAAAPHATAYGRVKRYLRDGLAKGRWMPGQRMPSEAELVGRFAVSRMTVNRALRELVNEGLVERVQGVGTFAAELVRVAATLSIRDLHAEIEARGHRHRAEVHIARAETATGGLAGQLGVAAGAEVFHTLIVHHDNDLALQCEDRYVNPAAAPHYLEADFTRVTPTQYLLEVAPLWKAQYGIEASAPTQQEARLLGIDDHAPCLVIVRRTLRGDVPITLARLVHPGSRYHLQGSFEP